MKERIFDWKAQDGTFIHAREWRSDEPKGVLCIAHGLGEHIGRYEHLADWFTGKGFTVMGYDRRGHGKSGGKLGHTPNLAYLLDEIAQLLIEAETRYQKVPIFLYGHSQGGGLVLSYLLHRNPNLAGVIASAPWIRLAFEPPALLIALGKLMRRLYPAFQQSNSLDPEALSRDPEVVEAYKNDPLVHDRVTAGAAIQMMEEGAWLEQQSAAIPCPLLIMHGTGDRVTSAEASQRFAEKQKGEVQFKAFPDYYHELHNEPEKEAVFQLVFKWLSAHL